MIEKIRTKLAGDNHLMELLKGSGIAFLLKLFGMVIGYISMLYITNNYGATVFGVLTLSITILTIFALIPNFGMATAIVRIVGDLYSRKRFKDIKYTLMIIFIFTTILSLLFILLLNIFSSFIAINILNKIYMNEYLKIISIAILSNTILVIVSSTFQGMKDTKQFIFFQTVLLQLVFLILLILNNYFVHLTNIVQIYTVASILSASIAGAYLFSKIKKFNKFADNMSEEYNVSKIIQISAPMLLAGSFGMLMGWTDIIMIGMFKTEAEVGIYSAALKVAGLTSLSLIAINSIAAPKFVEFYTKKDIHGLKKIARQSTKIIFFTSFPLLVIYILFPKFIMSFFGDEFISGASVLVIVSLGQFTNAISGSVGYIMQMTDNQKKFQNITIIIALINISLNYVLIPKYGINGAAVASMISMILWNIITVLYIKKKLGFWTIYLPEKWS